MKKILLMLLSFCFYEMAYAQHPVQGTVTAGGESVPGVSVMVEGTTSGTTTDIEGNYSLDVATGNETLVFSFIGYATQVVPLNGRTKLDINLEEDVTELQEVVVIGYGTQKKNLVTGATVKVSGDDLEKLSNTNALQSMQGQSPGISITSQSGQPGSDFNVNIRGVGTTGDASPLYIVDGMPVDNINYLNNADIASIDVLKDAASAAIYGSRAANGVVQITTKQGKAGGAKLSFDAYYGVQSIGHKLELLDAREYATMMNEQAINSGNSPYFTNQEIAQLGEGTDWLDQVIVDNAKMQNYNLGLTGGNENSVYSSSLSYTQQEGVLGGKDLSNYERYVFRMNSEHHLYDDIITLGENITYSYVNQNGIQDDGLYNNSFRSAFNTHPLMPVFNPDGTLYSNAQGEFIDAGGLSNPYAEMIYFNQNESNNQRMVGNIYLEAEPIEGLTFKTRLGVTNYTSAYHSYTPAYELSISTRQDTSSVSQSSDRQLSWNWENTLKYHFMAGLNDFEVLLGTTWQKWDYSSVRAVNANSVFDDLEHAYINNTTYTNGIRMQVGGEAWEETLQSFFGRVLYNYDEKYLLNATFRYDGSSKFADGNRWGFFPSFSAGWVASYEDFFKNLNLPVNFLKLRASWGQNGNNRLQRFAFASPIKIAYYSLGTSEPGLVTGAIPYRLANPDLIWETSEQIDIGLDAEFLDRRLSASVDWYRKSTKDWLVKPNIVATAGSEEEPFINGGLVVNKGLELALSWSDQKGDFNYTISANGAYNQNEVKEIPRADGFIDGGENELWNNAPRFYRAQEGFPIGYFWGYETNGVFQNEEQIQNYRNSEGQLIQPDAEPGDLIYKDRTGDGRITSDDKTEIGNPNPDLVYGFNITLGYKGFDFSINANGVAGNQLVQSYRNSTGQYSNYSKEILDRWHGEGTSNELPRITENGKNYTQFSDIYIKDGDFLRINNITLGYDFSNIIKLQAISQLRFYLTAQNLFTFTKYSGMDPEVGYGSEFTSGVDIGYYPRPRVLMAGVNVKF
ncbi:TonB-dependent receptor [Fulvivirga maritima]|uniref:SusC/RagA family TonB-linked outer membrane protein n=1 Tax=Fulvivirga maritima TaxID=2904247 RepID=UPI001F1ADE0C|nr:TonB-dependent receptor [Fulvivirga maritima]UII24602.1 TonB-dependent receptor [Fulvivirga maritima]